MNLVNRTINSCRVPEKSKILDLLNIRNSKKLLKAVDTDECSKKKKNKQK